MKRSALVVVLSLACVQVVPLGSDLREDASVTSDAADALDVSKAPIDIPDFEAPTFDLPRADRIDVPVTPDVPVLSDVTDVTSEDGAPPVDVITMTPGGQVTALAPGARHTCALRSNGIVWCWGANDHGQLGDETLAARTRPVFVHGLVDVASVAAGAEHTCAVTRAGRVWCWGNGSNGRLMNGATTDQAAPVDTGLDADQVAAGAEHTCVLRGGRVRCAGANTEGQLGDGTTTDRATPVEALATGRALALGAAFSCALAADATVSCWGRNVQGELGADVGPRALRAQRIPTLSDVSQLAAGARHVCALRGSDVWCWGDNTSGQLGVAASASPQRAPVRVTAWESPLHLLAGDGFTCARTSGAVRCAGDNAHGQLGDDTRTSRAEPSLVLGFPRTMITLIATGPRHACALTSDNELWCWGDNAGGQLGDGSTSPRMTRVRVAW